MPKIKKKKRALKDRVQLEREALASHVAIKPKIHTVLLNGEHALLRAFLRAWLNRFNHLRVVAEASDAAQALKLVTKHKPSLLLWDFDTAKNANLDLLAKLRIHFPRIKVIIYFTYIDDTFATKVIRAGASGFVLKSAVSEDMERAIKTVMNGGVYLSPGFLKSLGTAVLQEGVADKRGKMLSPRYAETLKLFALGLSTKSVASELKVSTTTVEVFRQALMSRLGVKSNNGLMHYGIAAGLVPA